MDVQLQSFLTSVLHGGNCTASRPRRLSLNKRIHNTQQHLRIFLYLSAQLLTRIVSETKLQDRALFSNKNRVELNLQGDNIKDLSISARMTLDEVPFAIGPGVA